MSAFIKQKVNLIIIISLLSFSAFPLQAIEQTKTLLLNMEVKAATCTTAIISDINFEHQIASNLLNGKVSLQSTLNIDCSKGGVAPDTITLRLQPASPHADSALSLDGYIRADGRSDIGYRLTWSNNKVGNIGDGIPMDTDLTLKSPQFGHNTIDFDVTAIVLGSTPPAAGNASTSVTVKISYS